MYQMSWQLMPSGVQALHLRLAPEDPWQLYVHFPNLIVKNDDDQMSQGWATYQALRQTGQWELIIVPVQDPEMVG